MYHRLLKLHAGAHALAKAASAAGGSPAALRRAAAATAAPPPRRASTAGPGAQAGDPGPLQETRALHTARRRPVASARTVCPPSSHRPRGDPAGVASSAPARRAAAVDAGPKKALFDKILVANRGEIAIRVMKTAKRLGVKTVAVYSEADKEALHVKMADEAYLLGPAASAESYLRIDKIIDAAKRSGAQAIHPGYGFLSENPTFANRLAEEGITFIGPPASAIEAMGSKSESKRVMIAAGVPCVPGYHGTNQDPCFLKAEADKIGYPVLIKAVKGGGGKGMRIVEGPESFDEMLTSSRREAIKSFGDDNVLIEKYLVAPRHVEVQVFADTHGNAVYLFERDCSVQRRHQKIIEEAPAPNLTPEIRRDLGEKAVAAAKAVNYVGAGTVEFIMDSADCRFYFMEMNTRLQVEHPVTEMVTGTDLVQWQLEVAAGNLLPKKQEELKLDGWAFEARIYAENPANNFLPDTGRLVHLRTPQPSSEIRIETGVTQGDLVSVHYDPMIAKLVVRGEDRTTALRVLRKALEEYEVAGPRTNIEFLRVLASNPHFVAGEVETGFIKKHNSELFAKDKGAPPEAHVQAAVALALRDTARTSGPVTGDLYSPWASESHWSARINDAAGRVIVFDEGNDRPVRVRLTRSPDANACSLGFATFDCEVEGASGAALTAGDDVIPSEGGASVTFKNVRAVLSGAEGVDVVADIGNRQIKSRVVVDQDVIHVFGEAGPATFTLPPPAYLNAGSSGAGGSVKTPMPCKIAQVLVKPGQFVEKGAPLVILEAMKMEHVIKAPAAGVVARVMYNAGDLVEENKSLVAFAEDENR